jgi:Domain of unknown function (DUF4258)
MNCTALELTSHVVQRMFSRHLDMQLVEKAVQNGLLIRRYEDDTPYPSVLLLYMEAGQPLHVVVAQNPATGICVLITVYVPNPLLWDETFTRKL